MRRLLGIVTLFSLARGATAQDITVQGYLDELAGWVNQPQTEGAPAAGHFQNSLQNRLNTRYYPVSSLRFECDLRTRLIYQQEFNSDKVFTSQLQGSGDIVNLNAVLVDQDNAALVSQADRLYADWTDGPVQLTLGRQRIAWGTNLVWNPTDLFNPFSVLDFDYEERPGVDALRVQVFTGPTSKIELAGTPGATPRDRTGLALVHVNSWNYDFNFLGGSFHKGYVLGFSWAGQVLEGGFRGEMRWTGNQQTTDPITLSETSSSYFTASLSGDYTFESSFYIHSELLFNGNGVRTNAGPDWSVALARGELSPSRWSIYQEFSGDVSPLVRLSFFGLVNPEDESFVLVPSLTWSMATNWDLLLIALIPGGQSQTEFSSVGSGAYVRAKWSF